MKKTLRQLKYPKEHRIPKVKRPPGAEQVVKEALEKAIQVPATLLADDAGFIVNLCTKLWRVEKGWIEKRLIEMVQQDEPLEVQRFIRRLEDVKDVLREAGIEYHHYTGEKYDPGLTAKVLAHQPQEGIAEGQEVIIDTVEPAVYRQGKQIAPGVVIVGISALIR